MSCIHTVSKQYPIQELFLNIEEGIENTKKIKYSRCNLTFSKKKGRKKLKDKIKSIDFITIGNEDITKNIGV